MRYMLMMNVPRGTGEYESADWSPEDVRANNAFIRAFNHELKEAGEWVDGRGLRPPGEAKRVHAGRDGVPVTDGPFPESREFLAGFWIVEVDTHERAYELAARVSLAPGAGGAPLYLSIEVRQVMSAPPSEEV